MKTAQIISLLLLGSMAVFVSPNVSCSEGDPAAKVYDNIEMKYPDPTNALPQQQIKVGYVVKSTMNIDNMYIIGIALAGDGNYWVEGHGKLEWNDTGSGTFKFSAEGEIDVWVGDAGDMGSGQSIKIKYFVVEKELVQKIREKEAEARPLTPEVYKSLEVEKNGHVTYPAGEEWQTLMRDI